MRGVSVNSKKAALKIIADLQKEIKQIRESLKSFVNPNELCTIANYAKRIGKSVTWVYQLGRLKEIEIVEIDGVKFVKIK